MFVGYQNITYALTIATMHSILCIFFKSSSSLLYVCNFRSNSLRVSFLGKIKLIIIVHHLVKISGFLIRIYIFFLYFTSTLIIINKNLLQVLRGESPLYRTDPFFSVPNLFSCAPRHLDPLLVKSQTRLSIFCSLPFIPSLGLHA